MQMGANIQTQNLHPAGQQYYHGSDSSNPATGTPSQPLYYHQIPMSYHLRNDPNIPAQYQPYSARIAQTNAYAPLLHGRDPTLPSGNYEDFQPEDFQPEARQPEARQPDYGAPLARVSSPAPGSDEYNPADFLKDPSSDSGSERSASPHEAEKSREKNTQEARKKTADEGREEKSGDKRRRKITKAKEDAKEQSQKTAAKGKNSQRGRRSGGVKK